MKKHLLIVLIIAFFGVGCETDQSNFKPGYSGSFGELIVVVPEKLWQSNVGDSIFSLLNQSIYGLPQEEPYFTLIHVKSSKFKSVLKTHRNVLMVGIASKYNGQEATYTLKKNVFAKGQVIVDFTAPNATSFLTLLKQDLDLILSTFSSAELNRLNLRNAKFGSSEINEKIKQKQGYSLITQKDVRLEKNQDNLLWVRLEREKPKGGYKHQISQGLLVYKTPYTSKLQFLDTNIRLTLDSILKREIPGPEQGNFMGIADNFIPPQYEEVNFKNAFAKTVTGLWEMKGNYFGGPFHCVVTLDEQHNEIIYIYGYVFSPQFNKREYLREVKAMIHSFEFQSKATS